MLFQPVRGTHDVLPEAMQRNQWLLQTVRRLINNYGFEEMTTPIFEFAGVFHRLGASSDIITKETYTFKDRGGEEITLRPEGTAGVVRAILSNGLSHQLPLKYFYVGPMFRYERPQKGRYRQFDQLGVELLGINNSLADIEIIALAMAIVAELDITTKVKLEINTIGDQASRQVYREALVNYFNKYNHDLSSDSQRRLVTNPLRILDSKDQNDQKLIKDAPRFADYLTSDSRDYFTRVCQGLNKLNIDFVHNPLIVRGLDYYCHTTFEIVSNELGAQGAIIAGGRYDGLAKQLGGPSIPGIGWAAGLDRLMMLAKIPLVDTKKILVIPVSLEYELDALQITQSLRQLNVRVEISYSNNLAKSLKKADKLGIDWVILVSESEMTQQQVILRNLRLGQQEHIAIDKLETHLKKLLNLLE